MTPALAGLLWVLSAHAGPLTWCVGGYTGATRRAIESACNMPAVVQMHQNGWHHHVFLRKDNTCYDCWDEQDNTCISGFLYQNPDYERADWADCARLGVSDNATQIISHVINGEEVHATPAPTRLNPVIDRVSPGPYTAGDEITLRAIAVSYTHLTLPTSDLV